MAFIASGEEAMNDVILVQCALQRIEGKSVITLPREEWHHLVLPSGEPTRFKEVPRPLGGLMRMAAHVITAGSGVANPDAGIDVVRYDPDDAPYIYNIDHYTVIENFSRYCQMLWIACHQAAIPEATVATVLVD